MAIARSSFASRWSSGVRWMISRTVRITPSTWRVLKNLITRRAASTSANSRSSSSVAAGGASRRGALNGRASSPRASASSYSMRTTACPSCSEAYAGLVGMVTTRWHRSSASFGSPLSSRPNSNATSPASACATISAAAWRGRWVALRAPLPRGEPDHVHTVGERSLEPIVARYARQDVLRLVRDSLDSVGIVLARIHQPQIPETEILEGADDVGNVDQVLGLVQNHHDAHEREEPNAERGMRNAEQQGGVVRRAAPTLTFRVPRSDFRVRIIPLAPVSPCVRDPVCRPATTPSRYRRSR